MAPLKLKTVCSGQEYHEHFNGFSLDQKKKKKKHLFWIESHSFGWDRAS